MDSKNEDIVKTAIHVLNAGKIILYPTDTVYGIGANIFNKEAVLKVYKIKKRSLNKPISVCVSKIDDISKLAYLDKDIKKALHDIFPGPFTVILNKKESVPSVLTAGSDKIGIRIPDNKLCQALTEEFPITTTSANLSGHAVPHSVEGILKQLGDEIDLIIDAGNCKHGFHSTVIDMSVSPPKILRRGANLKGNFKILNLF